MSKYHAARHELKSLVTYSLRRRLTVDLGDDPQPDIDDLIDIKTDQMLDSFEILAARNNRTDFWRGVLQSGLAAVLVFILIAIAALVTYGSKQNPFQILVDAPKPAKAQAQQAEIK